MKKFCRSPQKYTVVCGQWDEKEISSQHHSALTFGKLSTQQLCLSLLREENLDFLFL